MTGPATPASTSHVPPRELLTRSDGEVSRPARLLRLGRATPLEKMRKLRLVRCEVPVEETEEA